MTPVCAHTSKNYAFWLCISVRDTSKEALPVIDDSTLEEVVTRFNNSLMYDPSDLKMGFTIRDPLINGVFQVSTPRGFAKKWAVYWNIQGKIFTEKKTSKILSVTKLNIFSLVWLLKCTFWGKFTAYCSSIRCFYLKKDFLENGMTGKFKLSAPKVIIFEIYLLLERHVFAYFKIA